MKGLWLVIVAIIVLFLLMVNSLAVLYIEDLHHPREDTWSSDSYGTLILIEGNDGLATSGAVGSGNGVEGDPYMIKGLGVSIYDFYPEIYGGNMTGFQIRNTSAHLVIRECSVEGLGWGMSLSNVSNCVIDRTHQSNTGVAYYFDNCTDCRITAFEVAGIEALFRFRNSSNITISSGRLHWGVTVAEVSSCHNVTVFHNDFADYSNPGFCLDGVDVAFDAGYSQGGNFWGRYYGDDDHSGRNQNHWFSDGIGDEPYETDGILDRYPMMDEMFYSALQGRVDRAANMFPVALIANLMLVPVVVLLIPKTGISVKIPRGRDIALALALALSWPSLVVDAITWTDRYEKIHLPEVELAIFACAAAYVGFLARDTEWNSRDSLRRMIKFGFTASFIPIVAFLIWTSLYSVRLATGSSTIPYIALTAGGFTAAGILAWYLSRSRKHDPQDLLWLTEFRRKSTITVFYSLATAIQIVIIYVSSFMSGYTEEAPEASLNIVAIALPASAGTLLFLTYALDRSDGGTWIRRLRLLGCLLLLVFSISAIVYGLFPTMGT